jgi:hypothetical protein
VETCSVQRLGYFLEPVLEPDEPLVEGAAAIVFGFSFFGFLASRLPRCSPLGISALHQTTAAYHCSGGYGTPGGVDNQVAVVEPRSRRVVGLLAH